MKKGQPILVTDSHRGVYFGHYVEEYEEGNAIKLENARHCFYYSECEGTYSLATKGPQKGSRIGPKITMVIRDVATITECTKEATKLWNSATWKC